MMGALLLARACHGEPLSDEIAAAARTRLTTDDTPSRQAPEAKPRRISSARHLLFAYYSLRGLSLLFLPATLAEGGASLRMFAVFYGLDWVATVPPTVKLTSELFGRENTGVIYGWIGASHQLGASMAAFGAGAIRSELGDYRVAFLWRACCASSRARRSYWSAGRCVRTRARPGRPSQLRLEPGGPVDSW